jgi:hypothetical protein
MPALDSPGLGVEYDRGYIEDDATGSVHVYESIVAGLRPPARDGMEAESEERADVLQAVRTAA